MNEAEAFGIDEEAPPRASSRLGVAMVAFAVLGCIIGDAFRPIERIGEAIRDLSRPQAIAEDDPTLTAAGKRYADTLRFSFAEANKDAAAALERGKDPRESQDILRKSFADRRVSSFEKILEPSLERIVPSVRIDAGLSEAESLRLARAYRSVAKGAVSP